jgi:hypothetical protein
MSRTLSAFVTDVTAALLLTNLFLCRDIPCIETSPLTEAIPLRLCVHHLTHCARHMLIAVDRVPAMLFAVIDEEGGHVTHLP